MLTLALTWLVVRATLWTSKPGSTSYVLGLFLLFGGSAMALLAATAALSKLVPALVFAIAAIRFQGLDGDIDVLVSGSLCGRAQRPS
jgi:hypothetical protein